MTFETSKGNFDVKLFGKTNPVTVANFISNINKEVYKNQKFYNKIAFPNTTIIQSGIYAENERENKQIFSDIQNDYIPLEIAFNNQKKPKYNMQSFNPMQLRDLKNYFDKGSIAMKKINNYSSSTEFFFSLSKSPELDGRYAIFGKVINGFEVLESLADGDKIFNLKYES